MYDPAPPPRLPRPPTRKLTAEDYSATLRRLQEPFDAMVPTPLMGVLLVISLGVFLWTVCFVSYNDYDRQHPGTQSEPTQ